MLLHDSLFSTLQTSQGLLLTSHPGGLPSGSACHNVPKQNNTPANTMKKINLTQGIFLQKKKKKVSFSTKQRAAPGFAHGAAPGFRPPILCLPQTWPAPADVAKPGPVPESSCPALVESLQPPHPCPSLRCKGLYRDREGNHDSNAK